MALKAGRIDMAVAVAPAPGNGSEVPVRIWTWARSPFAIAVGKDNPVAGVTGKDLAEIYSGRRGEWPDGTRIRPVMRPMTDTVIKRLEAFGPGMPDALAIAHRLWGGAAAITDQDAATALETIPGAIGPIAMGQVRAEKREVRILALDGVQPSAENLATGAYRHANTYQIVVREPPGDAAAAFLAYLQSPPGRAAAAALGYIEPGNDLE